MIFMADAKTNIREPKNCNFLISCMFVYRRCVCVCVCVCVMYMQTCQPVRRYAFWPQITLVRFNTLNYTTKLEKPVISFVHVQYSWLTARGSSVYPAENKRRRTRPIMVPDYSPALPKHSPGMSEHDWQICQFSTSEFVTRPACDPADWPVGLSCRDCVTCGGML